MLLTDVLRCRYSTYVAHYKEVECAPLHVP